MSNNHKNSSSKQKKGNPILEISSFQNEDSGYKKPVISTYDANPVHYNINRVTGSKIGAKKGNKLKGDD